MKNRKEQPATTTPRIRIGAIGCGWRITMLLELLLKESDALELAAICDPREGVFENAARKFNPKLRQYRDYRKLVEAADLDWIMIGSWNNQHAEHAIAALKAGKHVFCEKPLATTIPDCLAIHKEWAARKQQLSLGFTLRYSPHYRKIKELITRGMIGDIISVEMNETLNFNHGGCFMGDWRRLRKNSGGYMLEKCCHDIDLAIWLTESLPVRTASFGGLQFFLPRNERHIKRVGQNEEGKWAYRAWPMSVPRNPFTCRKDLVDNQVVIMEFANGVHSTFHTNANAGIPERRMYVCGTEGAIRADVISGQIEWSRIAFKPEMVDASTGASGGHGGGDEVLCRELADSMLKGEPPSAGVYQGLYSAIASLAIDQAMQAGKVVNLRPYWKKIGTKIKNKQ